MNGRLSLFETVFFFHPAVWWLSRQVRSERNHCCDDEAVSLLANRREYGRALLAVAELRGSLPVLALGMRGSSLQIRVRRVCGTQPAQGSWASAVMCLILAVASVAATVLACQPADVAPRNAAPRVSGTEADQTTGTSPRLVQTHGGTARRSIQVPHNQREQAASSPDKEAVEGAAENDPFFDPNQSIFDRPVTLLGEAVPLRQVLSDLGKAARTPIELDLEGLKLARLSAETRVSVDIKNERLETALQRVMAQLQHADIYFMLDQKQIFISTRQRRNARLTQRLPEWLRPFQGNGLLASLDADGQVVGITAGSVIDDALIGKLKTLTRLKKLEIETSKQIGDESFRHIGEMPALESLNVSSISVTDQSLEHLSRLKTLRELSLREARISDDGIAHLKAMKQLRALRLGGNRLTDIGIAHLRELTNLEVLEIPHGNWVDSRMKISDAGLKYVGRFTKLRELDISGLGVTDDGFAHLAGLHDLRALSLGGTQITGVGLRQLVNFPKLESLSLGGTWIRDDAMEHVSTCGNLKRLHLGYTRIGDEGFRHLEKLEHLEHLSIDSRYVTDSGLAHLRPLARLTHLDLRASHVTDVSLEHISEIKSLKYLSLNGGGEPGVGIQLPDIQRPGVQHGRNFTAAGYAHLAALPNLHKMHLTNADVRWTELRPLKQLKSLHMLMPTMSQDDVRQLQKALPATYVSAAWGGGSVAPLQWQQPPLIAEP